MRDHGIYGEQGFLLFLYHSTIIVSELLPEISDTSCTSLTRTPLQRSGRDFTIMKVLPAGVYQYRFLVDGQWRYSPELPWGQDDVGNAYNVLDLQVTDNVGYARKRVELIDLEMNSCCLVNNH